MSVSTNIKREMARHDISTAELSERSGVSKGNITKYLAGHITPADEIIERLACALGCRVEDLCKPKEPPVMRGNNVPVETAARVMGKSTQWLRVMLQQGRLPFGSASRLTGNKYTYYIDAHQFEMYTGVCVGG